MSPKNFKFHIFLLVTAYHFFINPCSSYPFPPAGFLHIHIYPSLSISLTSHPSPLPFPFIQLSSSFYQFPNCLKSLFSAPLSCALHPSLICWNKQERHIKRNWCMCSIIINTYRNICVFSFYGRCVWWTGTVQQINIPYITTTYTTGLDILYSYGRYNLLPSKHTHIVWSWRKILWVNWTLANYARMKCMWACVTNKHENCKYSILQPQCMCIWICLEPISLMSSLFPVAFYSFESFLCGRVFSLGVFFVAVSCVVLSVLSHCCCGFGLFS